MSTRVAPDIAWVVDESAGTVAGQRLVSGEVHDPFTVGSYLGTVADEAAMVALTAAEIGDEVYRTDTGTIWKLRVEPYSGAANWLNIGGGSGVGVLASDAAIASAASGSTLSGTPCYYMATDTGNVYWCPSSSEAYFVVAGSASPRYLGRYTTVADLEAVATPAKGDQAMIDLSGMPFPFFATYTGSAWRATASLLIEVAGGAGTTSASEQCAASWIQEIPAGLLRLFRRCDVPMFVSMDVDTDDFEKLRLRLGSSSAGLSNALLYENSSNVLSSAGDVARDPVHSLIFNGTNSVLLRGVGPTGAKGAGNFAGGASSGTATAVTLGGSDDFGDLLYFSATADMSGTSSTPSISYALMLYP